ncbi:MULTISPECIES: aminoglycoside phosphotransferase [Streptomyces]|uniref:Aminoglycoside phosphotransferase n=1 Tax=Streptomyces tsukubensis (strain DSM 42081 / NBRC 108919 / NRRL 18488 / 9993) TaxID=1114943 RepID=A0A7G3UMK4_STRT9|nr:aminoglycoside phosphotransferase [Streptomyces tsukubensis]MYS63780.1 aminoglycoside phosphotransferase [Streptomyces sp. SID5473]QKM71564.1 aminoglycoside phosphotransferase [Streptomyces tsukubensis NRRL18488]TAI44294.1 aminoglycoside phosphotransferase [Streptomyces tsukubensis]
MATARVPLEELPVGRLTALAQRLGPIIGITNASGGLNSDVAARVLTSQGAFYVKGMRTDHPRVWTQAREASINSLVAESAGPGLRWREVADGWDLNVFDAIDGHHADYRPGSVDLPLVARLLTHLSTVQADEGLELRLAEQRLGSYAESASDLDHFRGNTLCHTDLNNENVIVADGRARLVDWAWATRGAAWLDAAYWVIWLIAAGRHRPFAAERTARRVPAFRNAPDAAVTAFAVANANLWAEITAGESDPWTARVDAAAQAWLRHRRDL